MTAVASRPPASTHRGPLSLHLVLLAAVIAVPVGLAVTIERYTYDIWGAFVWGPVVLLLCVPLTRWVARRAGEPDLVRFLMGAAFLKVIVGSVARYVAAEVFYGGLADAARYDNQGTLLAPQLRRLDFTGLGEISGTRFIEILSGAVQALIGDTRMGNFFVFAFMGFAGMCLLYAAFGASVPDGDRRLFRWLLFLTPTMWFWPSSIGKEAVMLLCLGAATLGAAGLFHGRFGGVVIGGLGLWGMAVVRPHLALIFFAGVGLALLPLRWGDHDGSRRWAGVLLPFLVVLALPLLVDRSERFLGIEDLNVDSAEEFLTEDLTDRTTQGGSQFTPIPATTPGGFVNALVTVVGRPFPWEVRGAPMLSAIEASALALVLLVVAVLRFSRLVRALSGRVPRLALGACLAFAVAFSAVGNFGILARQRSLLLPFAFVVVAAAAPGARRRVRAAGRAPAAADAGAGVVAAAAR